MRVIALKVDDDFYKTVQDAAKQTHRSISQYVRDILSTRQHPFIRQIPDVNNDR